MGTAKKRKTRSEPMLKAEPLYSSPGVLVRRSLGRVREAAHRPSCRCRGPSFPCRCLLGRLRFCTPRAWTALTSRGPASLRAGWRRTSRCRRSPPPPPPRPSPPAQRRLAVATCGRHGCGSGSEQWLAPEASAPLRHQARTCGAGLEHEEKDGGTYCTRRT